MDFSHYRSSCRIFASVYGDSGKKFPHFLREGDLGSRGRALFCAIPGSTVVHVLRQFWCIWTYFTHFQREGGCRIVKSCCLALLLDGEVRTVDASGALRAQRPSRQRIHICVSPGVLLDAVPSIFYVKTVLAS